MDRGMLVTTPKSPLTEGKTAVLQLFCQTKLPAPSHVNDMSSLGRNRPTTNLTVDDSFN